MDIAIEIIGYLAAIIKNISMYPTAYNIHKIIQANEYNKLLQLSSLSYSLEVIGCILWLIYSISKQLYPITAACIINIIPNSYITYILIIYKPVNNNNYNENIHTITATYDETILTTKSTDIHENNKPCEKNLEFRGE